MQSSHCGIFSPGRNLQKHILWWSFLLRWHDNMKPHNHQYAKLVLFHEYLSFFDYLIIGMFFFIKRNVIIDNTSDTSAQHSLISVVLQKQVSYRYHDKRKSFINGLFAPFMKLCLLFKLDFVTAFLCTFIVNFSLIFIHFIDVYFHYFYLSSLLTSREHHPVLLLHIFLNALAFHNTPLCNSLFH